jgi:hypothetical protein
VPEWNNGTSVAALIGRGSDTGFPGGTCVDAFAIFGFRLSTIAGLSGCNAVLVFVRSPRCSAIRVVSGRRLSVVTDLSTHCGGRALRKCMYRKAKAHNCYKRFHCLPLIAKPMLHAAPDADADADAITRTRLPAAFVDKFITRIKARPK